MFHQCDYGKGYISVRNVSGAITSSIRVPSLPQFFSAAERARLLGFGTVRECEAAVSSREQPLAAVGLHLDAFQDTCASYTCHERQPNESVRLMVFTAVSYTLDCFNIEILLLGLVRFKIITTFHDNKLWDLIKGSFWLNSSIIVLIRQKVTNKQFV